MRINKYLRDCGICSRREADILIGEGRVLINGEKAEAGSQVTDEDCVMVNGNRVDLKKQKIYLAYNKPKGIVCTSDRREPDNIIDRIDYHERVTYAGRLDKDSEGLIILTDDGDLINLLMSASERHEKEYVVTVSAPVKKDHIKKLSGGLHLDEINMDTRPCKVVQSGEREFHITLTQGINRQIRRMCKAVGLRVVKLVRIRVANIELGKLGTDCLRPLTRHELKSLKDIIDPDKDLPI